MGQPNPWTTLTQGTFPERLESASNSFACTRETALLSSLFNRSSSADRRAADTAGPTPQLVRFPPDRACRSAAAACQQCLAAAADDDRRRLRNCSADNGERFFCFPLFVVVGSVRQCFDGVGRAAGRASGL